MICLSISGFNHFWWHAPLLLLAPGIMVFTYYYRALKGHHYYFDAKHNEELRLQSEGGTFKSHSQRYNDLAKLLIALSGGVIAFLVNTLVNEKPPSPDILRNLGSSAPIVVGFFGSSMAILILFMAFQASWYEEYCHKPLHDSYVKWKYAFCNALGVVGLIAFATGIIWFASNLF